MDPRLRILPERRLAMTAVLRQSLEILQMPQAELAEWLLQEIEKNPLLEATGPLYTPMARFDREIEAAPTLYAHLQAQMREAFPDPEEMKIAEMLLLQLDEKGYLEPPIPEGAETILAKLQNFDPPGIFARNLQECLLLQLKNEKQTPAYPIVRDFFSDLLQGRYGVIRRQFSKEDLASAIHKLSQLAFRPAALFQSETAPTLFPDLSIVRIDRQWRIEIPEHSLPSFRVVHYPLDNLTQEEKIPVREWRAAGKWIYRAVQRRKQLLLQIGAYLAKRQSLYLNQKGKLALLTLQEAADELQMHISTLSRTLAGKYANTPRGIIPLRSLLSFSVETLDSKEILGQLIAKEEAPLTDAELARLLRLQGIKVARRTIAKYRKELKIGSARGRSYSFRSNAPKSQPEISQDTEAPSAE